MGIASTTKTQIIHSSFKYNGMQIPTCWDLQGVLHSHLLIGHCQLRDLIGQHMLHIADYFYLHLGLQEKIFSYDFEIIKDLIPSGRHATTWEYLSKINATATIPSLHLKNQRQHDTPIMKYAYEAYF